jgi:hypothetical protein
MLDSRDESLTGFVQQSLSEAKMSNGLTFVIVFVCGFAGAQFFDIWRERVEQRSTPPRPYGLVMEDIDHAIPQLVGGGVYWFYGSLEDARQLRDIVKALQPSLNIAVMKIERVREVAIINTQHTIFGNGGMLLREVEEKLTAIAPASN